jgi:transketolase
LIATGSEVSLAVEAHGELTRQGVKARVVSFPSWKLFEEQPREYREQVLPPNVRKRLSIEAGVAQGWRRWVGDEGDIMSVDTFGASAPYKEVYKHFGLTVEDAVKRAMALLGRGDEASGGGEEVPGHAQPSEGHS